MERATAVKGTDMEGSPGWVDLGDWLVTYRDG